MLLAFPLFMVGCESGTPTPEDPAAKNTPQETSSTSISTTTSIRTEADEPADGPPYEGDTKTEDYTFSHSDGSSGSGIRVYTFTDGAWTLTSDSGAEEEE